MKTKKLLQYIFLSALSGLALANNVPADNFTPLPPTCELNKPNTVTSLTLLTVGGHNGGAIWEMVFPEPPSQYYGLQSIGCYSYNRYGQKREMCDAVEADFFQYDKSVITVEKQIAPYPGAWFIHPLHMAQSIISMKCANSYQALALVIETAN